MENQFDSSRNRRSFELVLDPFYLPPRPSATDRKLYSCTFCRKKFYSSQALGGHQNAHRLERTLAKKSREFGLAMTPHPASTSNGSSVATSLSPSSGGRIQQPPNVPGVNLDQHRGVWIERTAGEWRTLNDDVENGFWRRDECINVDSDDRVEEEFSQLDLSLKL